MANNHLRMRSFNTDFLYGKFQAGKFKKKGAKLETKEKVERKTRFKRKRTITGAGS